MIEIISAKITSIFPDDINTDDIIPAWTLSESGERKYFAKYAFANYDSDFVYRCQREKVNIIVAGKNFACGSSREQAVYALQENNVVAVIAKSFPDIFYRNALNNGLTLIFVNSIKAFELGSSITIDLNQQIIKLPKKIIKFKMSKENAKAFNTGEKLEKVKKYLTELLKNSPKSSGVKPIHLTSELALHLSKKPQTIVEKIVSDHLGKPVFKGSKIENLPIDILFFNEVIGPVAIKNFQQNFADVFKKNKKKLRVFDHNKIFFIPDHTVPSSSITVSEGITLMEEFARDQGIKCYKEGDGIEHVVLIEDGYIVPGKIILGTDSHTDTNGALNTLSLGIGTTDSAYTLATGYLYDFEVPETLRVNLSGSFSRGVYAKDLILYLIGELGVSGASKKVVEFAGPALLNLSMDARTTIANMAVEMGARTAIFEPDETLKKYLKQRAKFPFKIYLADKNCKYEKVIDVDLSTLEPIIAFPHKPSNTTPITRIKEYMKKSQKFKSADFTSVTSLKITDAFLGACTNGRYEDFVEAARILKNRQVHPQVNFVAIPASRKVYNQLLKTGILEIFVQAGVNIESSNCGPCFGKHMGVLGKGTQMISSSNRNYIGRMGSKDAKIFLASPVTVAASAVAGEIVDPRKFLNNLEFRV